MYFLSPDTDRRPDSPVGTPETRRSIAIHWHWTTELTNAEIGERLGVTEKTVANYLDSPPAHEVRAQMDGIEAQVRMIAVRELKDQLRRAGHESKTAEAPVKVWEDADGNLAVADKETDDGDVVDRYAVPQDVTMGPDSKVRFFRREEVREILDLLCEITGAKEPAELAVGGRDGGPIEVVINDSIREPEN